MPHAQQWRRRWRAGRPVGLLLLLTSLAGARAGTIADGCDYVYVDVGSNIGVQVRKLFEPELYERALVAPYFDRLFGTREVRAERARAGRLCAFGFEPTPTLQPRLVALEAAYRAMGWRVTFFTRTAATVRDGPVPFFYYDGAGETEALDMGSSLISRGAKQGHEPTRTTVRGVDLGRFLVDVIGRRARSSGAGGGGAVAMKVDIEGEEARLVPDLMRKDAFCDVDYVFIEYHANIFLGANRSAYARTMADFEARVDADRRARRCRSQLFSMDDETYMLDNGERRTRAWRAAWGAKKPGAPRGAANGRKSPLAAAAPRMSTPFPTPAPGTPPAVGVPRGHHAGEVEVPPV